MRKEFSILNQFLDIQKNMFESWQNFFVSVDTGKNKEQDEESNVFDPMRMLKEMADFNQNIFTEYLGNPHQIFQKINQSKDVYLGLHKLWDTLDSQTFTPNLKSIKKIYDDWVKQYNQHIKNNYISHMPQQIQEFIQQYIKLSESYQTVFNNFWQPWLDDGNKLNSLFLKSMVSEPKTYLDYIRLWKSNYDKTFSKVISSPAFGINREFIEKQFESTDKFIQYNIVISEFYAKIYSVGHETIQKLLGDYMTMLNEGTQPKTFDEFYKVWTQEIEKAFDNLFISDDFAKLIGHLVEASTKLKTEIDKLIEEYISFLPIPKKSDLDSLYKTVYDLKKQIRNLKKEANGLKSEIETLQNIKPNRINQDK